MSTGSTHIADRRKDDLLTPEAEGHLQFQISSGSCSRLFLTWLASLSLSKLALLTCGH